MVSVVGSEVSYAFTITICEVHVADALGAVQ